MTMHLEGPWLTTIGKRKGKSKFRSAEQAKKSRELDQSWIDLQNKWKSQSNVKSQKGNSIMKNETKVYRRDTGPRIPSLNNGLDMSPALKTPDKVYTGTKIIGIGTMHKSNAVPIFSDDQAKEISSMRR